MDALDRIFERFPRLVRGLKVNDWMPQFDRATLERAVGYANGTSIRTVRMKERLPGSGEIIAEVKGTASTPYRTWFSFKTKADLISVLPDSCNCPVGYRCKHAAAVMFFLTKRAKQFNFGPKIPVENAMDWQTEDWLQRIQAAVAESEGADGAKPYNKILAYCIEKDPYRGHLLLTMRVGTEKKSGEITVAKSFAAADLTKPPKYMAEEDYALVSRFRQLLRSRYDYQGLRLEGKGCGRFLADVLATTRLFVIKQTENRFSMVPERVVEVGPPESVKAVWKHLDGGKMKPSLEFSREGLVITPTDPIFYVDFQDGVFGKLESDLPGNMLALWETGPSVSAALAHPLGEKLRAIPGNPIPPPIELEEILMPEAPVVGVLRIRRADISGERTFIADPFFRYGESPEMRSTGGSASARTFTEISGDKRLVWLRDPEAETELLETLIQHGFEPLAEIIRPEFLGKEVRYAMFRESRPDMGDTEAWIAFLEEGEADSLREAGWEIVIDPKAGLAVRDISDFFPEIETEPDHGIDWFRFDVSGEMDGKKFSLIPLIAKAISDGILDGQESLETESVEATILVPCENEEDGFIRFPEVRFREICQQVAHLFRGGAPDGPIRIDRLGAADLADSLSIDSSETNRALAKLGKGLKNITTLPVVDLPKGLKAELRGYQAEGFSWLQFLGEHGLHGILADDMGLGKTVQTLAHLCLEANKKPGRPSLVIAPTSVVPNWAAEAERFTPGLKVLTFHGADRAESLDEIPSADIVLTSYPLLTRDMEILEKQDWHSIVLDEAQYIKNPKAIVARNACKLKSAQRLCLSGTPMENHLGELWSLMRFLMPGFLGDEKSFNSTLRRPIERDRSTDAQKALNRRVAPLILRRTKDQVATELPEKTEIIHHIDLTKKQTDLYESVRAAMDKRVRDAIAAKGLAKSHIIVLDALLKLRQICCHPQLLKLPDAAKITESAKLDFLTTELLPTLLEEGRRILLFSQFTSMLALIEEHLEKENIPFLKLTGQTKDRATLVKRFQSGEVPIFLISLKAGGTGLNLTAADTVIHYDPWWNPAAENQATDRAHRIGQKKPVFVHKLACTGTIEDRILDLQKHKSALVEALLSEETSKLKIDSETLSHLLSPLD